MRNRTRLGRGMGWIALGTLGAVLVGRVASAAAGPPCPCPAEVFLTKGDQYVIIEWEDPPDSLLFSTTVDASGWSGGSVPVAGGFDGDCDEVLELKDASPGPGVEISWSSSLTSESGIYTLTRYDTTYLLPNGVVVAFPLSAEVDEADGWGDALPTLGGFFLAADSALYTVRAEASGTVASTAGGTTPGLDLSWEDSVGGGSGTLTIVRADSMLAFDQGLKISFAPGEVFADSTFVIRARVGVVDGEVVEINGEAFTGYKVWRSDVLDLDEPRLVKKLVLCGSSDPGDSLFFACTNRFYVDGVDPWYQDEECQGEIIRDPPGRVSLTGDVDNAFPYYYGVTTYDEEGGIEYDVTLGEGTYWKKIYPSEPPRVHVSDIRVIPNPYNVREEWEEGGRAKIIFDNLPSQATVYVYNVVGELIIKLEHSSTTDDFVAWDGLKNADGEDVVSGVYMYKVESSAGDKIGKFIVIR